MLNKFRTWLIYLLVGESPIMMNIGIKTDTPIHIDAKAPGLVIRNITFDKFK